MSYRWNHSTSREAATSDSPVRERGGGESSIILSAEGATLAFRLEPLPALRA